MFKRRALYHRGNITSRGGDLERLHGKKDRRENLRKNPRTDSRAGKRGAAYFSIDYYTDGNGERLKLYDDDGRAAAINLNGVKKYSEYITDIDAFIEKANAARDLIEQKKRELKQAQHDAAIYSDIFDPYNI